MALTSEATAIWKGTLFEGSGDVALDSSGLATFPVNWKARTEGVANTTNPEELLAAAHASCFCMQLSNALAQAGHPAESIQTTAAVTFEAGKGVLGSHLLVSARVPGITEEEFEAFADGAKENCPISQALAIPITIEAELA
jgi:osmotically inducible protein OsmC